MNKISIAIHGGAGTILPALMTPEKEAMYRSALNQATQVGLNILQKGGTSLDAVEVAVKSLEDFPLFNAGKGAVFTNKGTHEMDAAIMNGKTLEAGAIAGVTGVINPIALSRAVMEKSGHVMLCGEEAIHFAKQMHIPLADPTYFYTEERYKQWQHMKDSDSYVLDHTDIEEKGEKKFGTVGAVALDMHGNLAAATSTGGMTNKRFGRIGDSPVIGAGTYANNHTCAISCTGHGEYFLRAVVAYDISCLMEYKGLSLEQACNLVVKEKLVAFGGEGGLVAADALGNLCLPFNSEGMYRAWAKSDGQIHTAIYKD